jgi:hypothetical protein
LDTGNFLPARAIVYTAGDHHKKRASEVCAGLQSGEVGLFDNAYVNFDHLHEFDVRVVSWVARSKENSQYTVLLLLPVPSRIRKDDIIRLKGPRRRTKKRQGWTLRRVETWVEVDAKEWVLVFI